MSSSKRYFVAFLAAAALLITLFGVYDGVRIMAEGVSESAVGGPLILSAQQPRLREISSGGNAEFTVSITNTGSVTLQTVSATEATVSSCSRGGLGPIVPGGVTSYTCSRNNISESFLNEIQITGSSGGTTVSHRSNSFVKVLNPDLRIVKSPKTQTVVRGSTAFFTIVLFNTSDSILTNVKVDDNLANSCDLNPTIAFNLGPGESRDYSCSLPNVQAPLATIATVEGTNPFTAQKQVASDVAWVELLSLQATLTPQPTSVPEPGDLVMFTIELVNTGSLPLTPTGLTTNQYGNLLDPGNPLVDADNNTCLNGLPLLAPNGGSFSCTFEAPVTGQPSDFSVILTAKARDPRNTEVTATTNAKVVITNVPASIALTLGANPPFINPPSRPVTFSIRVDNTSEADAIIVTELTDEFLGNLDGQGTCNVPSNPIPPGSSYQCQFTTTVSGQAGQERSRTISVKAIDDDLQPETLSDSEVITVGISNQPTRLIFMPNVSDDTVEPNNSCSRAYPLRLNRQYAFRPPAKYPADQDYFSFELTQNSRIRVELTNFVPRKGQLVVRRGDGCEFVLGRNPDEALNKVVDLGTLQAADGPFFIQLINDGPSNVTELYRIIVRTY